MIKRIRRTSTGIRAGALALMTGATAAAASAPDSVNALVDAMNAVHPIAEVAVSPDGRHIIYGDVVTGQRDGAAVGVSALWIVNSHDGTAAARLTACPTTICDEHAAAWSPDGRAIAFVTTDGSGQTQIAVADAVGQHINVLTHAHGPLDSPRWSPDAGRIAFLYAAGAPKTPGPLNPLARDAGELSSTVYEQRLALISAQGGAIALRGPADLNVYEYDWAPDGRRFVVSAAHGSGDDNWWIAELDLIDAESGALSILAKPSVQIASPRWSGDGKRIAYIGGIMSDEGITGGDVYLMEAAAGTAVDVTPHLAASVQTITWNGSNNRLIATEFAAGDEVLASIDADAKQQRELWRGPMMIWANTVGGFTPGDGGVSLSKDGSWSAVIRQSYTSPPEVMAGPPGHWHALTHLNDKVSALTGKATNVYWVSDGAHVQGMLIEPKSVVPGKRYPLVVEAHGGPAYAHYPIFPSTPDFMEAAVAAAGYYVFMPNPRGSYGQGEDFARANIKDFGYGDLRDILSGLDAVERTAPIDPARVGIMGWSYGGYMSMWALTQTDRFKAAVAGAGLSDWLSYYGTNNIDTWMIPYFGASVYDDPKVYERSSPMTFIKNVHAPTLMLSGDRDAEVPISQSYEYWNALRRHGVKTKFVVYPDEGHDFFKRSDQIDVLNRTVSWFDTFIGSQER